MTRSKSTSRTAPSGAPAAENRGLVLLMRWLPVAIAVLVTWTTVALVTTRATGWSRGMFTYALDDAYIHLAMARNLAESGQWSVGGEPFTSASSGPLWTLLLGLIFIATGPQVLLPFILNLIFTAFALVIADLILAHHIRRGLYRSLCLIAISLLTPFVALIVGGMEHVLQIVLTLAFVEISARSLSDNWIPPALLAEGSAARPSPAKNRLTVWMLVLAPLVGFIRYEDGFLVLVVCILLALRRRLITAVGLGLVFLIPIVLFGIFSVRQGWYFLPNSIMLKAEIGAPNSPVAASGPFVDSAYSQLLQNLHLLFLVFFALLLYLMRFGEGQRLWSKNQIALTIFVVTAFMHMQFAQAGWFFRYEAYLMAIGLVYCFASWAEYGPAFYQALHARRVELPRFLVLIFASILLLAPSITRAIRAVEEAPQAMHERYLEHVWTAKFVTRYYPDSTVLVNDIGAMEYYSPARVLDIYGLGNLEPVRFRREPDGYTAEDVAAWAEAEGVEIAITQLGWGIITERIPEDWILVGVWEMPGNVVFGDTEIGFWAPDPASAERLMRNLQDFAGEVPVALEQRGLYRGDDPEDRPADGAHGDRG